MRWPLRTLMILFCVSTTVRADLFAIEGPTHASMGRYSSTGQRLGTVTGSEELESLRAGPDAHLYVLSNIIGYGNIQRIDPATGVVENLLPGDSDLTKPKLTIPLGLVFDDSDRLYVGSNTLATNPPIGITAVQRYDAANRRLDPVITFSNGEFISPVRFDTDGTLLVSVNSVVRRYDPSTGADLGVVPPPVLGATGPDGNLYARDGQGGISRYQSDGTLLGQFIPSGAGGLGDVTDLTFGGDGYLYVNSQQASAVLRYRADTGAFVDRFIDYSNVPSGVIWDIEAITVPEPGSLAVLAGGAVSLATLRPLGRRGRKRCTVGQKRPARLPVTP